MVPEFTGSGAVGRVKKREKDARESSFINETKDDVFIWNSI